MLEKARVPLSPLLLGIVLGQLAEQNLRRSLIISHGDVLIFLERPVSAVLLGAAIVALVSMIWANRTSKSV